MNDLSNVVLVTIDSLRADHCSFMRYERETTPAMDEMAEEGIVYENAIAPGPSTPESMPSIFTGQYPVVERSDRGGEPDLQARRERIRQHMEKRYTLPERLSDMGYRTGGFTPNPFTSRFFGFDQGFDHFQDFMGEDRSTGPVYDRIFQGFLQGNSVASTFRPVVNWLQREEVFKPWETFVDDAIEWASRGPEPYFLWLFLMDAHNPYTTSDEYRTQSRWETFQANWRFWRESHETPFDETIHDRLVTAYDDSIRYADAGVGRLREALSNDRTTVVVHADHGEAFGEHGHYGHEPYLYEENVHVPLVVDAGRQGLVGSPVSLRSLPDIVPGASERTTRDRAYVVSRTHDGNRIAVRGRHWKVIENGERATLYDVSGDEDTDLGCKYDTMPDLRRIVSHQQVAEAERVTVADEARKIATRGVEGRE